MSSQSLLKSVLVSTLPEADCQGQHQSSFTPPYLRDGQCCSLLWRRNMPPVGPPQRVCGACQAARSHIQCPSMPLLLVHTTVALEGCLKLGASLLSWSCAQVWPSHWGCAMIFARALGVSGQLCGWASCFHLQTRPPAPLTGPLHPHASIKVYWQSAKMIHTYNFPKCMPASKAKGTVLEPRMIVLSVPACQHPGNKHACGPGPLQG